MNRRLHRIKDICSNYKNKASMSVHPLQSLMIDENHKLGCCRVNKVGQRQCSDMATAGARHLTRPLYYTCAGGFENSNRILHEAIKTGSRRIKEWLGRGYVSSSKKLDLIIWDTLQVYKWSDKSHTKKRNIYVCSRQTSLCKASEANFPCVITFVLISVNLQNCLCICPLHPSWA